MCDQTIPYAPGAYVWVKLVNMLWWPGIVVEESDVPEHVLNTYVLKKRNPIAIVHFPIDNSFEVVTRMDSVCLYASVNKMKFVEKGYIEYTKQKKGMKVRCGFNMANFLEDVINIERHIGGDIHIFKPFENENEKDTSMRSSKELVKELFLTSKQLKARERKLSSTSNKIAELKKSYTKPTKTVLSKIKPSTSHDGRYKCYIKDGCTFSTNKYENLKRHTDIHKNEKCTENEIPKTNKTPNTRRSMLHNDNTELPLPKKRKYIKSNKKIVKNIKLQEEILKDWDDGEDLGENTTLDDNTNLEVPTDVSNASNKIFDFDESNSKCSSENGIPIYSPKSKHLVDEIETTLDDNSTTLNEFVKEANNEIQNITEVTESSIGSHNGSISTEDSEIIEEENNLMPSLKTTTTDTNTTTTDTNTTTTNTNTTTTDTNTTTTDTNTTTTENNCDKSSSNIDDSQPTSDSQLDPTVQETMCCMDTVSLTNSSIKSDNEEPSHWPKFIINRLDEARFLVKGKKKIIVTPKTTLASLNSLSTGSMDLPDRIEMTIPSGCHSISYERVEAWSLIANESTVKYVNLKTYQKLLKQRDQRDDVDINLNCRLIRH